jgi:hypothetical protein
MRDQGLLDAGSACPTVIWTAVDVPILDFELDKRLHGIKRQLAPMGASKRVAETAQQVFGQVVRGLRHLGAPLTTSCYKDGNWGSRSPLKLGSNT